MPIGRGQTRAMYFVTCTRSPSGVIELIRYSSEPIGDAKDMPGATTYDRAMAKALSVGGVPLKPWIPESSPKTCDYKTGMYVLGGEVAEDGRNMAGVSIVGDTGSPIPQSCSVNATDITVGHVDSVSVSGARGRGEITVMCVPNTSAVRVTAVGFGEGGTVSFDRAFGLKGKMTVDGVDGVGGIRALVGPAGGAYQTEVELDDTGSERIPGGEYVGTAVVTVTPE
ncbi:hypothetical protein QMK47_11875 [Pseudomonas sp. P9_35]|uniref:hypothetical protein n=1 Tax=unclassified Pseudomonas TaxID=196821 RepID=UPI002A358C3A|nr:MULTISPECIES: hypothetical protein [unclassified Pseudomonas]WPN65650.1 hypothetical protein QMK48_10960 [Pseudomonas sp. P9_32]WPN71401.1 hypothetical protein QMK47_11875 [Pseudomonas sp. P9_35]